MLTFFFLFVFYFEFSKLGSEDDVCRRKYIFQTIFKHVSLVKYDKIILISDSVMTKKSIKYLYSNL